ncbi:MAG: signal recognition particle protein [Holosporaceae bacterium]|nr:MAG: signal recognition particle protein [Holosporaceae bacterium]
MFQNLSERLTHIFNGLQRRGALTENDVNEAMREVRVSLLEADVALPVVKSFIARVKEKAVGEKVISSVTPGQLVMKIVHNELKTVLGSETTGLNFSVQPPAVFMMVGLQGAGKTTTTAKLAKFLKEKHRKKIFMASLDIYRPAAMDQLQVLGASIDVDTFPIDAHLSPIQIAEKAYHEAKIGGYDAVFLDTAGRLHVDEVLMDELKSVSRAVPVTETLLVVDSMTGQDAVRIAESFQEALDLTGVILTRLDGDARGGAALSMREVTGQPIKFSGVGEKLDQLEVFHPERVAGRILDQGDVISLVEKAAETVDKEAADRLNKRIEKGSFDLNDMATQLTQMMKMGGMGALLKMLPGAQQLKNKVSETGFDDKMTKRQVAIIRSMTPKERQHAKLMNASRRRRVAEGSGTTVQDVNRLLKQYEGMSKMMKKMGKLNKKGMLGKGLGNLFG